MKTVQPESVGLSAPRLQRINPVMEKYVEKHNEFATAMQAWRPPLHKNEWRIS